VLPSKEYAYATQLPPARERVLGLEPELVLGLGLEPERELVLEPHRQPNSQLVSMPAGLTTFSFSFEKFLL